MITSWIGAVENYCVYIYILIRNKIAKVTDFSINIKMEISLQPHFRGAEGVTHVKIEGTMGLDSLDFYPKSEVLCRLGRKSRGVKSITTYR